MRPVTRNTVDQAAQEALSGLESDITAINAAAVPTEPAVWTNFPNADAAITLNGFRGNFLSVPYKMTINRARIRVANNSGNISVAIYNQAGTTRLSTSGAIACPAIGNADVTLSEVTLDKGVYFVGMSADNTAATFSMNNFARVLGAAATASAHPAPTTVTVDDASTGGVPTIGLFHS